MNTPFYSFEPITKLNKSTVKWHIRVRAQAIWRSITRETKEFRGINIIFVDDSKCRIHGFINARFAKLFENDLQEGQIYNISNFIVQDYTGIEFHRCLRFGKHIYFADYTKLLKSSEAGLKIPTCAFDFSNLLDLEKMESDKRFLCDVVGVLVDDMPMKDYVNEKKETNNQKDFSITDGRCNIKVTFFDDFAKRAEESLQKHSGETVVVIISSAKIGRFQGELNLTNYPATRFYINFDHKAVTELTTRSSQPTFNKIVSNKNNTHEELMSVCQIKGLTKQYIQRRVVCNVIVNKIEENLHWYDTVCTKCGKILLKEDGRFKCEPCKRFFTWPPKRFRICLLCSDSSGGIPIILHDREVRRLTGKTVFDIELDQAAEKDEDSFPSILRTLKGKQYMITLDITADNVNNISDVYEACDINAKEDNMLPEKEQLIERSEEPEDHIEIIALGTQPETNTPDTGTSSVKSRVRKSPEETRNKLPKATIKTKIRTLKIKQEKGTFKQTAKNKSSKCESVTTKKCATQVVLSESEDDDEQMSLRSMQQKNKRDKRQAK